MLALTYPYCVQYRNVIYVCITLTLYRDFAMKILHSKIWREKLEGHVTKLMIPGRGPPLVLSRAYFGFLKKSIFLCHTPIYVEILA